MKPMKTLNGYEIVDAKAREDIEQLKQSGGSGADLTNYYTKEEIDELFKNIATAEGGSY